MNEPVSTLPKDGQTIAELRELYRAAEARAARLRLLSVSGRELAEAEPDSLQAVLARCAERLAFFSGYRMAKVAPASEPIGIAIHAPGPEGEVVARLVIGGLDDLGAISDSEDRDAVRMHLELMGATIDRIQKERERADLLTALQGREKSLELLLEKIFTAQEEERRRVSHELHDGVAQTATALVRLLEGVEAGQKAGDKQSAAPAPKDVARTLVSELRRVIAGLRPTLLDDLGLLAALQSLGDDLQNAGYAVSTQLEGGEARLAPVIETALFRVAQEATSNIYKHAGGPCSVQIEAHLATDPLILRISDEGKGPSKATRESAGAAGHNVGIEVMKERMSALGGTLEWRARTDTGVVVEARLPLRKGS